VAARDLDGPAAVDGLISKTVQVQEATLAELVEHYGPTYADNLY